VWTGSTAESSTQHPGRHQAKRKLIAVLSEKAAQIHGQLGGRQRREKKIQEIKSSHKKKERRMAQAKKGPKKTFTEHDGEGQSD